MQDTEVLETESSNFKQSCIYTWTVIEKNHGNHKPKILINIHNRRKRILNTTLNSYQITREVNKRRKKKTTHTKIIAKNERINNYLSCK